MKWLCLVKKSMYRVWLTVLGTGYSPFAPGTCGSAVVTAIFLLAVLLGGSPLVVGIIMLVLVLHGLIVTVLYGDRLIAHHGPDPSLIVSDEQCGQALTYLCFGWMGHNVTGNKELIFFALAGFVLFRLLDIIKPPPARQFDNMKNTWGVALDDVAAGVYANIILQIGWWLIY
jgi:phosphatidylglycerophosphatase A